MSVYFLVLGFFIGWASFRAKFYLSKKYHYRLGFKDGVERAHYSAMVACNQFKIKRIDSGFVPDSDEVQITTRVSFDV